MLVYQRVECFSFHLQLADACSRATLVVFNPRSGSSRTKCFFFNTEVPQMHPKSRQTKTKTLHLNRRSSHKIKLKWMAVSLDTCRQALARNSLKGVVLGRSVHVAVSINEYHVLSCPPLMMVSDDGLAPIVDSEDRSF